MLTRRVSCFRFSSNNKMCFKQKRKTWKSLGCSEQGWWESDVKRDFRLFMILWKWQGFGMPQHRLSFSFYLSSQVFFMAKIQITPDLKLVRHHFSLISLFSCKTDHFPPNEVEIKIALSKFGQLSFKTPKLIK